MSKQLTHLSLFTGIGGLDLAAEWAGFKTVGQCEFADYPHSILEKRWQAVPKWRDIHDLSATSFRDKTGLDRPTVLDSPPASLPHIQGDCGGGRITKLHFGGGLNHDKTLLLL